MRRILRLKFLIAILSLVAISACAPRETPPTFMPELTYEEHLAVSPPPPKDVTVSPEADGVRIAWEPSDPVTIQHGYGDEVLYYKVFRSADQVNWSQLGTTTADFFLDTTAPPGGISYYCVTAVHKGLEGGEVEGDRSDPVPSQP